MRQCGQVFGGCHGDATHCSLAHSKLLGDTGPGQPIGTEPVDLSTVEADTWSSQPLPPGPRRGQARAHPPPNQLALELRNRREDPEHQPAVRGGRIHALVKADEVNSERVELAQGVHQLPQGACEAVIPVDQHRVELPSLGVCEEAVECRTRFLRARNASSP